MKNLDLGKNENSSKGITLVALVISIIVLLILATVSIQTLTGNNGLLTKTETAVQSNKDSQEEEKVKLAVVAAQLDGNGTISTQNLGNELKANFDIDSVDLNEKSGGWLFKLNKEYTIYKDGKVEVGNLLLLPKEYQQVEYIENTSVQFIDTLFRGNQDTKIVCEAVITDSFKSEYYQGLFGATDVDGSKELNRNTVHMHRYTSSELIVMAVYGDKVVCKGFKGDITKKHIYELDKNIFKVDNNMIYTYDYKSFQNTKNINIFRDNNNLNSSQNRRCCLMKLYSFLLYDDNELVRNFIPCYSTTTVTDVEGIVRAKDTIGLYDIVNNKFYTNKESGTFEKGNDV